MALGNVPRGESVAIVGGPRFVVSGFWYGGVVAFDHVDLVAVGYYMVLGGELVLRFIFGLVCW